ncbi:apolipoprotein D [Frankliniella occidentalis]|uniref:Apolipoprotein D n=1 Tax=Frankliniella occidentalis TaxID=133901 RepID=A0A6J1T2P6_FRAOC|nr:apolipoprotein D [Frankliniella occidentalis]
MMKSLLVLVAALACAAAHSYHLGSCPNVEPMSGFEMDKFLGKWYVIQKTSTGSRCLVYNFTRVGEAERAAGDYRVEQISEHLLLGLTSVDHKYRYSGLLRVNPDSDSAANMTVQFPLSVAGSASYRVFMTDYDTYAAIFTCQRLAFANRQSVSILARKRTLDKQYIDKIRNRMSTLGVDPFDLSIISQDRCVVEKTEGVDINIDEDTFTAQSAAGVVRKAGEKIGDGIEYAADGAKKLYHTVRGEKSVSEDQREQVQVNDHNHGRFSDQDAEWLP